MIKTFEVNYNGKAVEIFCNVSRNGYTWYVVDGGTIINLTWDTIDNGVDVDSIEDVDCISVSNPIRSVTDFENFLTT